MARYRKVDVRIYADEKFRALSAPQPNAQTLWLRLLTGEHTGIVPGLSRVGEAALAEQLGWPLASFRRCFAELATAGMVVADWGNRLVWLPNSIRYNEPDNQKVVTGWRSSWDEMPDCALKASAWVALDDYMEARDEQRATAAAADDRELKGLPFREAFRKACPQPSSIPFPKPYPDGLGNGTPNKEQEQEQEQDRTTPPRASARGQGESMGPEAEQHPTTAARQETASGSSSLPVPSDPEPEQGASPTCPVTPSSSRGVRSGGAGEPAAAVRGVPKKQLQAVEWPLTAAALAVVWDRGWEAAWPRDRIGAGQVEKAIESVGVATAVERLMAMVADDRAQKLEPRPWLGWHVDVILGRASGARAAAARAAGGDIRVGVAAPAPPAEFQGGERELR